MNSLFKLIKNPFSILLICLIVVVICLNNIIELARPKITPEIYSESSSKLKSETRSFIDDTKLIDYQSFHKYLSPELQQSLSTDVSKLSPIQQDSYIRYFLLNRKIEKIEKQIPDMINKASPSLIFNISFWIWSLFLWAASIVGGEILVFYTKRILHGKCL